jgi:glycogen operon protein
MSIDDWQSPENRTLQYLVASTPEFEPFNRMLLIVHGLESETDVTLPAHEGVETYTLLWDSADDSAAGNANESPSSQAQQRSPGSTVRLTPTSMQLYRAN